jgi:hypothetical protein
LLDPVTLLARSAQKSPAASEAFSPPQFHIRSLIESRRNEPI